MEINKNIEMLVAGWNRWVEIMNGDQRRIRWKFSYYVDMFILRGCNGIYDLCKMGITENIEAQNVLFKHNFKILCVKLNRIQFSVWWVK